MSIAETIVNTTAQVRSLQAKVCCNPVVVGPRTGRSVRPANRVAVKRLRLIPQGRILEVSTKVWLNPLDFRRPACPERDSRSLEPCRRNGQACQGLTSEADDALRCGVTQHISVVLTALGAVSRAWGAGCEAARCSNRSRCGPTLKLLALPGPVVPNEIFLRLTLKAATEVCCNPPSISISDLPGPTTTGDRSSPRRRSTSASLH